MMKKTLKLEYPGLTKENFKNWITDSNKKSVMYLAGINRPIIPYHVTKLAQALTIMGIIRPIVIANISFITGIPGWYIVDGQHLFNALLRLGMDIPYVFIDVKDKKDLVEKIALLNASSKTWSLQDYVTAWSSLENDYVKLNNYFNIYDLEFSVLATILANQIPPNRVGNSPITKKIKNGEFRIVEEEHVVKVIDQVTDVLAVLKRQTRHENIYLCSEYVSFCKNSVNYDHKKFMKNLNDNKKHFILATQEEGKLKELFETLK
jgi:hypothetical protein